MKTIVSKNQEKKNTESSENGTTRVTIMNPKGFEKSLQNLLKSNQIEIEIFNYKNFRITKTPTDKFPDMVTITRTLYNLRKLLGKRFVNLHKAKVSIDFETSMKLIEKGRNSVQLELQPIGLGDFNW